MMRKIAIVILSCLLYLCSCSTDSTKYKNQEKIEMNYNNITNGIHFWLTTDSICYSQGVLTQKWFLTDKNSTARINKISSCNHVQRYGKKIYLLDSVVFVNERNSKYELKAYDVDSQKTEKVCSIKNCESFLILDEVIYYLENTWVDDVPTLALKKISIDSGKHTTIESSVISFGVIENSLYYIVRDNNRIIVFQYTAKSGAPVKCGEFLLEESQMKMFDDDYFFLNGLKVSYTPNNLFFSWTDYDNETTTILKHSFEQNAFSTRTVKGYMNGFASYKANSYFIISSEKSDSSELYKLNNKTDEIAKIAEFQGEGSLFVGSDEGAYVLRYSDGDLAFYSNEGNTQVVYQF